MKKQSVCYMLSILVMALGMTAQSNRLAFQPYNTQGDNLIHITTADFDGVGAKDYVVAMTVDGKVIAFQRPDLIIDPAANNRLWEYSDLPSMGIRIFAGDAIDSSPGDEVILPGTDGHIRILSSTGALLMDKKISTGALYTATVARGPGGQTIIATAGVDGFIYFLDPSGAQLATVRPRTANMQGVAGVIRHVVAGDFNGNGTDEVMSFVNNRSFEGNCFFDITDLATYSRPDYWDGVISANTDDTAPALGFTDKQLPHVFDMDGDGNDEVVGHWGVFHPEDGPRTQLFSTMLTENETLPLSKYERFAQDYLIQNHGFRRSDNETLTNTGKYLLQHGVPGNFSNDGKAELFTVYGDDLFLSQYEPSTKTLTIKTYTWAHSMYHFTDAARLQNRDGGADKVVLAGPANGDDHFYVVDLTDENWRTDARTICCAGTFAKVEDNLNQLTSSIQQFTGTIAEGNEPIWFIYNFDFWMWWEMTDENIAIKAQEIYDTQQEWYDKIGEQVNYRSSRIRLAVDLNSRVYGMSDEANNPNITAEGMVKLSRALAEKGVYFCLQIGHGFNLHMSAENFADCYEASVIDGECYMMGRTRELREPEFYIDYYKPHLDAVLARAEAIGEKPPMVMLCAKGATISSMPQAMGEELFPKYKDVLVPGVENSNVTLLEMSLAERVGLWMNGDVKRWGCNVIGDNLAANRVAEWGGMRNAHVVLRQMLSQYALGARVFRITAVTGLENPLFVRGDVTGEDQIWSQPFQKGVLNFLKIVEKGIYPHAPEVEQLKAISPVAVALYNRSERLREQNLTHRHFQYQPESDDYVINRMASWGAYTDVPENDLTSFLYGTVRRWDNLLPAMPGGFICIVPHKQAEQLETKPWWNKAYQTNGDIWNGFSNVAAKEVITSSVLAQRDNLDFHVEGECFWQVTQDKNDPNTYFVILMGNSVLTPVEKTVTLKGGKNTKGEWKVFDQLSSAKESIGEISYPSADITLTIPAGTPRLLCIRQDQMLNSVEKEKEMEKEMEKKNETFIIYPNPANSELNIQLDNGLHANTTIIIYNSLGKVVKQFDLHTARHKLDVSDWAPGMYLIHLMGENNTEVKKVIVYKKD